MARFCPDCGNSVQEDFTFCPSCGARLSKSAAPDQQQKPGSASAPSEKVIICDNCGGENQAGNSVCEFCGIKLSGVEAFRNEPYKVKTVKKEERGKKASREKQGKQQSVTQVKELEMKKVWITLAVVAVIGFIILLASGVFDSPSTSPRTDFSRQQTEGSGVDLSNLPLIKELEDKYKADPSDNETLLRLAHLKQDSGLYEQAIINYREYLSEIPDNADARIDMGVCYYNLSRYDEAIAEMTKALEYSPNHQIGHLNLGIVNLAANNLEKSREWLQKAFDINPDSDIGKRAQELLRTH
jgi:TolA-binding protein